MDQELSSTQAASTGSYLVIPQDYPLPHSHPSCDLSSAGMTTDSGILCTLGVECVYNVNSGVLLEFCDGRTLNTT